jgi:hypothetical protein
MQKAGDGIAKKSGNKFRRAARDLREGIGVRTDSALNGATDKCVMQARFVQRIGL